MIRNLVALIFWAFLMSTCVLLFFVAALIWALTVLFDKRLVVLHLFSSFWASLYIWVMPAWSVTIEGREKLDWNTATVMVSNHQSLLDILVAFGLFFPFKWVSKAEIFKVPFVGWNMVLNRYVKLVRGNKDSGRQMLADCEAHLTNGSSVYLFPEGTRSPTGLMRDFKPGAFILAQKMQVPIQPIVINGTQNALPKKSIGFHGYHKITLKVLDAIPYQDFSELSVEETAELVKQIIAVELPQEQHQKTGTQEAGVSA